MTGISAGGRAPVRCSFRSKPPALRGSGMIDTTAAVSTESLGACPLCDGTSWRSLPVPGRWIGSEVFGDLDGAVGLVRCHKCGLVFTNPRPSSERLSAFYSGGTYACHESTGATTAGARADVILERIAKHLPREAPRVLLDYGAGGGGFLIHASNRGWEVRGFEPGKRGLESCRRAGLRVTDSLEDLPGGEFGLVTMCHVFEHLAHPKEVLEGVRRFLAPEGRLFIEVPNARSLRARLAIPFLSRRFRIDERFRAYPIHLMYYSEQTLREMLGRAGWTVEKTFTIGVGLEEFFVQLESSHAETGRERSEPEVVRTRKRRLRHLLRDAFLNAGLGENLAVIAYPSGGPTCNPTGPQIPSLPWSDSRSG